ncbi:NlpC/P60 family protein [Amaricoccus sp.]|uniref:C40 family peptidase n=1 Tax=Amaricoccus sp. TaxID=1872485 RepID=UPI0025C43D57|nr:NlpC/P60 family protein [Amaricoccus sp.]
MTAALLDLRLAADPTAGLATQLLHGEAFTVYEMRDDGLAWGQAEADGYVGYVAAAGLGAPAPGRARRVSAIWSHRYAAPAVKARVIGELPFLAEVAAEGEGEGFVALADDGFVPAAHLAPLAGDAVDAAMRFLGAPYLWGGRSARGLDCSALVQLSHMAAGVPAPRDSDMQAALLGVDLPADAPARRGDLVFWRGHVGMMVDAETLLHANAHHMAVALEPLAAAVARIEAGGGGSVTGRRRPVPGTGGATRS